MSKRAPTLPAVVLSAFALAVVTRCSGLSPESGPSPTLPSRPNIVLIIVDALRADNLGCYGFPEEISPEIDQLAQEGVLFENVIGQSSWTRPWD